MPVYAEPARHRMHPSRLQGVCKGVSAKCRAKVSQIASRRAVVAPSPSSHARVVLIAAVAVGLVPVQTRLEVGQLSILPLHERLHRLELLAVR